MPTAGRGRFDNPEFGRCSPLQHLLPSQLPLVKVRSPDPATRPSAGRGSGFRNQLRIGRDGIRLTRSESVDPGLAVPHSSGRGAWRGPDRLAPSRTRPSRARESDRRDGPGRDPPYLNALRHQRLIRRHASPSEIREKARSVMTATPPSLLHIRLHFPALSARGGHNRVLAPGRPAGPRGGRHPEPGRPVRGRDRTHPAGSPPRAGEHHRSPPAGDESHATPLGGASAASGEGTRPSAYDRRPGKIVREEDRR